MKTVTKVQREITVRVFDAMYYLISLGKIKNKKEFSDEINFTYSHFLRLESNENVSISLDSLYHACINLGISAEYLLTGRGNILVGSSKINLNQKFNQNRKKTTKIEEN